MTNTKHPGVRILLAALQANDGGYTYLAAYVAFGILAYSFLEGWSALDTTYFMMVTSTTVGYGDIVPTTEASRLFTCVYALLGTTIIFSALSPLVEYVLGAVHNFLISVIEIFPSMRLKVTAGADDHLSIQEVNARINYPVRYLRAALAPLVVVGVGVLIGFQLNGHFGLRSHLVDAIYFAVISCSTIGYGDVTPTTDWGKWILIFYLPCATTALAQMLEHFSRSAPRVALDPPPCGAVTLGSA